MLEEKPDEWHEASGVCISRSPSGRMKWPIAIKTMAIERIEAEATLVSVARDIGARESPVRKWAQDHRKSQTQPTDKLGIVEVVGVSPSTARNPSCDVFCELRIGDTRRSIPPGYPAAHLAEIVRALPKWRAHRRAVVCAWRG